MDLWEIVTTGQFINCTMCCCIYKNGHYRKDAKHSLHGRADTKHVVVTPDFRQIITLVPGGKKTF